MSIKINKGYVWKHKNLKDTYAMVTVVEFNFSILTEMVTFDKMSNMKFDTNRQMTKNEFLDSYFLLKKENKGEEKSK